LSSARCWQVSGSCAFSPGCKMTDIIVGIVALLVMGYLFYAMFKPERF
jgi:K+-transporting ATPase KdpF subunit